MTEERLVAGTIMAHSKDGKYVFLVEKVMENFSFPVTSICNGRTGLGCILESIKQKLKIEAISLDLCELTNAVVDGNKIPLFVFELADEKIDVKDIIKDNGQSLSWQHSEVLTKTLGEWKIDGVPQYIV